MNSCRARRAIGILAVTVALVAAACSPATAPNDSAADTPVPGPATAAEEAPSDTTGSSSPVVDDTALVLSPQDTVAALTDPARVEDGVWSLLANLGIGVYATDGTQILAGYETGPDDFFLNDFQIEWLATLARRPDQPFSDLYLFLTQFGAPITEDELLTAYREAYTANAGEWLPSFITASGVQLTSPPDLNPLVMWVMALDALDPAADTANAAQALYRPGTNAVRAQAKSDCQMQVDARKQVGWGYVSKMKGLYEAIRDSIDDTSKAAAPAKKILDPKDLLHALMMQALVDIQFDLTSNIVHERHDGGQWLNNPDEIDMKVTAKFVWDVPAEDRCFIDLLAGFNIPPKGGKAIEGVRVEWTFSPAFGEHGQFRVDETGPNADKAYDINFINADGTQTITYQSPADKSARVRGNEATGYKPDEPGGSNPGFHSADGEEVQVRLYLHLADLYNVFGAFMDLITPRTETKQVSIQWHEPTLKISTGGPMQVPGMNGTWMLDLQTCDGVNWTGSTNWGGKVQVKSIQGSVMAGVDELSLTMPEGTRTAKAPLTYEMTSSFTGEDFSSTSSFTASGTLTLNLDYATGMARVTLDQNPATQSVEGSADGEPFSIQTPVPGRSDTIELPIETADCGD